MNGYAIAIAFFTAANRLEITQVDFTEAQEPVARAAFLAARANPHVLSATLEGPGGIILAEYEAAQTSLEV